VRRELRALLDRKQTSKQPPRARKGGSSRGHSPLVSKKASNKPGRSSRTRRSS
jgi:hypothetical protein